MYILDTNALSENIKRSPNAGYMDWIMQTDESLLYTSCLSIGEAQKGAILLNDSVRRKRVEDYNKALARAFDNRILCVDLETAKVWARITAKAKQNGFSTPGNDAWIAAQAIQHKAKVVTRNIKDFEKFEGLKILCPWS